MMLLVSLFWCFVGLFVYVYFAYPALLFLLSKVFPRPVKRHPQTPKISIIIPAHNEEAVIENKIRNTKALDYPADQLEIIVVSDGSTDRTNEIIQSHEKDVIPIIIKENKGKTNALNHAVKKAAGDIIVFTDADGDLKSDALRLLVENFSDASVGCVAGRQVYTNLDVSPTSGSGGLYWKYEEFIKKYESRTGSTAGAAGGAIFGIRRELYKSLPDHFIDDFATSMLILAKRYRVITDPRCICYQKSATNMEEELRRRRRIANRLQTTHRLLRRQLRSMSFVNRWKFWSHKLLRWHTTEMFAASLILNALVLAVHPVYVILFIAQLGIYTLALLGFLLDKKTKIPQILNLPYYFVYLNLVHFLGVMDALRGKRHTVWQPPKTSRTS